MRSGIINVDIEVNPFPMTSIENVRIELNGNQIWSSDRAPNPGELSIDTKTLDGSLSFQDLTVRATDDHGMEARNTTVFRVDPNNQGCNLAINSISVQDVTCEDQGSATISISGANGSVFL